MFSITQRAAVLVAVIALSGLAVACGSGAAGGTSATSTPATQATAPARALTIVALGDSETTGHGDPSGLGWVERYARLVRKQFHTRVVVSNLAEDGTTSDQLLDEVRHDAATRRQIRRAAIVLLGIGGADLNAGDDAFEAGGCGVERCYTPVLSAFAGNFDAIVSAIRRQHGPGPLVLRSITQPNPLTGAEDVIPPFLKPVATRIGVYQARTANRAICKTMARQGGRCVDLLTSFNGADGKADAYRRGLLNHDDCCYPNAKGQQLMAEMLLHTGLSPLR